MLPPGQLWELRKMELLDEDKEDDIEEEALEMMKREVLRVAWDMWRKG
jgi:hypothetical protein